jgi:putative ABC transport system substrate-binding protein
MKRRAALVRFGRTRPDALYVAFEGFLIANHAALIAQTALQRRIALVSGWGPLTEAGGLLSYAPDIAHMFYRAASFVHRILKGAKPTELPVEQATRIELLVNLKTAQALGITIPQSVLVRADRLIQ